MMLLGRGRTALPVPPQAGQRSTVTVDFGFFKIILADPFGSLPKRNERNHGAAGHGGNQNAKRDAMACSRTRIHAHERYRVPKWPKNVTA